MEKLLEYGKRAVEKAISLGASEAEAFLSEGYMNTVEIERAQIVGCNSRWEHGIGVRIAYGKAVGFAYTTMLDDKKIDETVENALRFAKANKPDENWPGFSPVKSLPEVKNIYDKKIIEVSPEELVSNASEMLDTAINYDKRVFPIGGGLQTLAIYNVLVNSNGVEVYDKGTGVGCHLVTIAHEASEVTPVCFEYNVERVWRINPVWVGKEAAKMAVSSLKAKKTENAKMPVILGETALQALLYFTLISAVKADAVQREQSALKGKIGQKIASELLTIYDDGTLEGGINTARFDGEGTPTKKTTVIEKGILKNFLYDRYTANKDMVESTGNAVRSDINGYMKTPQLEATNFVVYPGDASKDEIIEEARDGLLVLGVQGAHSSNPATGEFSVVATPAWKIENGEIAYPVKGAMIAGDIYTLLQNISMIGKEPRKMERIVSPWIRVDNVNVVC